MNRVRSCTRNDPEPQVGSRYLLNGAVWSFFINSLITNSTNQGGVLNSPMLCRNLGGNSRSNVNRIKPLSWPTSSIEFSTETIGSRRTDAPPLLRNQSYRSSHR